MELIGQIFTKVKLDKETAERKIKLHWSVAGSKECLARIRPKSPCRPHPSPHAPSEDVPLGHAGCPEIPGTVPMEVERLILLPAKLTHEVHDMANENTTGLCPIIVRHDVVQSPAL